MTGTTSAPAKIILLGEHAVVYNQPAIAVPVSSLRVTATISHEDAPFQIVLRDLDNQIINFEHHNNPIMQMVKAICAELGASPPPVKITVRSTIPIASGLGSGAAISTAIARAVCRAVGETLSNERLNALVYDVETFYHGTPSGIDNTVIVYEQPVYFVRNQPIESIRNASPLTFIVADTGIKAPTHISVGDVRKLVEQDPVHINPIIETIGDIVQQARQCIENGDTKQLGQLMNRNHAYLQQLTVSSTELDTLVDVATQAGALGAKLSGGGRGGNMIALVSHDDIDQQDRVQTALNAAGAVRVFKTTVEATKITS